ncbi:MAG TPA: hypothetical protein VGP42_13500 [Stellaceae bacterium]|jgi:hypothetical protein|nr:hypothetical protein [Stellaceae bacterium]
MTRDETYVAGRDASAGMLADGYRAADQFHADVIDGAHETLKASSRNLADLADRDRAHGDASDARAYLYAEAEQRHHDRLAALAHHFGQFYRGPGNPAADDALDFVASIDLAGDPKAMPLPAPMPVAAVEFHGDAAEFNRIKMAGTRTPQEREADRAAVEATSGIVAAEPVPSIPTTPPVISPAPAGLAEAIAAVFERARNAKELCK